MKQLLMQLTDILKTDFARLKTARQEIHLSSGERIGTFAGFTYYRFETPEGVAFNNTSRAKFTFGHHQPVSLIGSIVAAENQYLTVALPADLDISIPEMHCSWDNEYEFKPTLDLLQRCDSKSLIPYLLFNPGDSRNSQVVNYEIQKKDKISAEQIDAVKKIWNNRVTMIWGPSLSSTIQSLILSAVSYMKIGRRVLFVSPSNENVDSVFLKTITAGEQLGINMSKLASRVDLPLPISFEAIANYSFENQIETIKVEKRKLFKDEASLVLNHQQIKLKQALNEDFFRKIQEKREKLADLRKQIDKISKEKTQLIQTIADLEKASLLDRLKKGFSKSDLKTANEQLTRQQQIYNRLLSIQQALSNEITDAELYAPVTPREMMELKEILKSFDELGGIEKVTRDVEDSTAVDRQALLQSKLFVAASINTLLTDTSIREQKFDLVIIHEAQHVSLPALAAISALAGEKLIVAGNPFETELECAAKDEKTGTIQQRDIFLQVAQTTELQKLFDWSEANPGWSVLMKSNFSTTPKLSLFLSSILFNNKIDVFAPIQTKSKIYFLDTSKIRSLCKPYSGKKKDLLYNELHTKRTVECVKHALMKLGRSSQDIGIILPFTGPTLHTKLQLRLQGIKNIEVGTPQSFCNRRKKAIIFDTTIAGVDYTMPYIDDRVVGEYKIARLFNTIASCVIEDLYIIADMSHFKFFYQDRLFTKILQLLQTEADDQQPLFTDAVKKFEDLTEKDREELVSLNYGKEKLPPPTVPKEKPKEKADHILEIQMKKMARDWESKLAANTGRNIEKEVYVGVQRVLGWRTDINLLSQFIGGDLLFRNSCSTEKAIRRLPFDTCENEVQFRDVMEKWNLVIYDMSGGSKTDMSFFISKGPEGRIRHDIRNLYAYYSSDVEAAIEEGKKKIAVEVARVFQELLGKNRPDSPVDWTTSYLNFLTRLEAYLSWISEQIRR
ncbi:MAG: hypothetical protein JXA06_10300 [Bacteroidetes bacterium]|nr:hypothetical protein [Bacteroidota bacterium]